MKTAVITSKKDLAGIKIKECLAELPLDGFDVYTIEEDTIFSNDLDKKIEADLFIFATRHQSREKIPSLSCHVPGNWNKAEFGGTDGRLCIAPALFLKNIFLNLNKFGEKLGIEITLECTHHGPLINKPAVFIEIGSGEEQWKNKEYGEVIAKTIIESIKSINNDKNNSKVAFGIGGPHYCSNFNKILLRTDIAVGHICPKYQLENLDKEMILQAIDKTKEKSDFVLLDWKGLGKDKQRIVNLLEELKLEYKRIDQLLSKTEIF